jgi:hypothetical protein
MSAEGAPGGTAPPVRIKEIFSPLLALPEAYQAAQVEMVLNEMRASGLGSRQSGARQIPVAEIRSR